MILVPVGDDDADQVLQPVLDEREVGEHKVDAGQCRIGEGHAEIDHQPFAVAPVQVDIHPDLAGAAERQEDQFVSRCHYVPLLRL